MIGSCVLKLKQMLKKNPFIRNAYRQLIQSYRKKHALRKITSLRPLAKKETSQYIVSLTSYGKRLTETAPYAIISLFKQTTQPDKIVLWVGENDKANIGKNLLKLQDLGLEIYFCEDIRSYTKLIYSLKEFPNACIITADDDINYPRNWFEQLIAEHKKYPQKIICHRVHEVKVDENYCLLPYSEWKKSIVPQNPFSIFPTGVGGILYPPRSLDKQVLNKELFMELAPHADDIWFWAMALINKEYFGKEIPYVVIKDGYARKMRSIDYRQNRNGNALLNINVNENGNDKQLKAVIEYFPQLNEVLKKIKQN
jgi:hypothetical protein